MGAGLCKLILGFVGGRAEGTLKAIVEDGLPFLFLARWFSVGHDFQGAGVQDARFHSAALTGNPMGGTGDQLQALHTLGTLLYHVVGHSPGPALNHPSGKCLYCQAMFLRSLALSKEVWPSAL